MQIKQQRPVSQQQERSKAGTKGFFAPEKQIDYSENVPSSKDWGIQHPVGKTEKGLVGNFHDIRKVQQLLYKSGYLGEADTDGIIGPKTVMAIDCFLSEYNIHQGHPIVSPSDGSFNKLINAGLYGLPNCSNEPKERIKPIDHLWTGWQHKDDGNVERSVTTKNGWTFETDVKKNGLAGVQVTTTQDPFEALRQASEEEINQALYEIKAGLYGDIGVESTISKGQFQIKGGSEAKGSIGAKGSAKLETDLPTHLLDAFKIMAEVGVDIGAEAQVSNYLEVKLGPAAVKYKQVLSAIAMGKLEGKFDANFDLNHGISIEGNLEASAIAEAAYKEEISIDLHEVELKFEPEISANVNATAKVEGEAELSVDAVKLGGEFDFFAGSEQTIELPLSLKIGDHEILKFKGGVSLKEGAGIEGEAEIGYEHGILTLKCDAGLALLLGAGAEGELKINIGSIVSSITEVIYTNLNHD